MEHNQKLTKVSWQWLTAMETVGALSLFVWFGFWIGYEFSKEDGKTFDGLLEKFKKEIKDHAERVRADTLEVEKENSELTTLVSGLKSDIRQRDRMTEILYECLQEERIKTNRSPEEANEQALEAFL